MSAWNVPPPTYDAHSTPYMTTTLTPYLQLPHLLSLTWLAYPILSLIFVAFRLLLSLGDAQNAVASAKSDLLASCQAAQEAATTAASMPRYMAIATNEQFADAVNGSMEAARAALVLSLTVMEAIINFIIDIYRSTFLCFLELVVQGGLAILIGAVQEVNSLLQAVTSGLRTSIQNDISSANSAIQSAIGTINKVNPFGNINVPQIAVPSLDSLQNVTLPASFEQALVNINASIPSVADIKGALEDVIDTPFELLKQEINDTFASLSFDPSGLPVPGINRLTFCDDLDTSIVDDIGRDLLKAAKIGVLILVLAALLLTGLNCLLTWYKWRCLKKHLERTRQAWMTDPTIVHTKSSSTIPQVSLSDHNLMMLRANSEHPLIMRIMHQISTRFRLSPSQHAHMQWFLHYIFHAPALACFLIGFFGLLSVEIQLMALGPLVAKFQDQAAVAVSDFSSTIATSINSSMYNQSSTYANEINAKVDTIQNSINNGVFGWVNVTTTTLNTTINTFYTDIQNAVSTVFNGTVLESPANDFIRCFLGNKVDAIENALTFLHNNLNVDMPRVNQSVLVLSPASVNEATAPIAAAALGGGQNDNEGLVGRLVNTYAESLRKERVMFGIFMALWGFVVLMGIAVLLWHSYGKPCLEQRRRRKWEAERSGIENMFSSKGSMEKSANEAGAGMQGSRSFTPLPSPRGSAFKPFWSSRSNSPETVPPFASSESLSAQEFSRPRDPPPVPVATPAPPPKRANKLISIGRKALGRERFVKDEDAEQPAVPFSPIGDPVSPHDRNTAWYRKVCTLLARKDPKGDADSWDQSVMDQPKDEHRPKLLVYTQKALDQRELPQAQSRWSSSPPATQNGWMNVMAPTKKLVSIPPSTPDPPNVVVSPASDVPPYRSPSGIPMRPRQNPGVPINVGSVYEDPFLAQVKPASIAFPIPLHNGFDSLQRNSSRYPSPPRHPQSRFNMAAATVSPPPPLQSPRMIQPQASLAPPPRNTDRHRLSSSMETATWRVTNAAPGDTASLSSSATSLNDTSATPITRLLTTVNSGKSSVVNPFITPFDDEHRVTIDHPEDAHLRKSIATNPFAVAI